MSTIQDNPFKRSDDADFSQTPPQKSNRKWLVGCGIVGLLGMLICCGGVAYFAYKGPALLSDALNAAMAGELQAQLSTDANVQERIGEIESVSFDFNETAQAQQGAQPGSEPRLAFRVKGSKGEGVVLVVPDQSSGGSPRMKSGTLVMSDGTEYPLDLSAGSEGAEISLDDVIDEGEAAQETEETEATPADSAPINLEVDTSLNP